LHWMCKEVQLGLNFAVVDSQVIDLVGGENRREWHVGCTKARCITNLPLFSFG